VSNPIEFLSTEEVWAYLLQNSNPWGGDNRSLYKLYASGTPLSVDVNQRRALDRGCGLGLPGDAARTGQGKYGRK
jgi:3'-phosphoadenosine 5'-phosphosulfate sulfotransferase (PAPS reductase)/FAD synthetase